VARCANMLSTTPRKRCSPLRRHGSQMSHCDDAFLY